MQPNSMRAVQGIPQSHAESTVAPKETAAKDKLRIKAEQQLLNQAYPSPISSTGYHSFPPSPIKSSIQKEKRKRSSSEQNNLIISEPRKKTHAYGKKARQAEPQTQQNVPPPLPQSASEEDGMKIRVRREAENFLDSEVLVSEYHVLGILGFGGFGAVLKARRKDSPEIVAIKCIYKTRTSLKKDKKTLDEINILKSIKNKHVVAFKASWDDYHAFYVVTAFHGNNWAQMSTRYREEQLTVQVRGRRVRLGLWTGSSGSLFDYIELLNKLPVPDVQEIFSQLAKAINYLHSHSIAHLDIKEENILIDDNLQVKLCDFGHSVQTSSNSKRVVVYGTYLLAPPEMWRNISHRNTGKVDQMAGFSGFEADIWALGLVLYTMNNGGMPKGLEKQVKALHGDPSLLKIESRGGDPDSYDLIRRMLDFDPLRRATIADVMRHNYTRGISSR